MLSADSFFTSGTQHVICQDYANTDWKTPDTPQVVISDGCSTAKNSDWGSRLIVRSFQHWFSKMNDRYDLLEATIISAKHFADILNLNSDALCATLLSVSLQKELRCFSATICGDGFVFALRKDKKVEVFRHEYTSGAPYYLYYSLGQELTDRYVKSFGAGQYNVEHWTFGPDSQSETSYERLNVSPLFENSRKPHFKTYDFHFLDYDCVGVISDGINSFQRKKNTQTSLVNENVPWQEIFARVTAFKVWAGSFVERRCLKAFKEFREEGLVNRDDFSLGAIYYAEPEPTTVQSGSNDQPV